MAPRFLNKCERSRRSVLSTIAFGSAALLPGTAHSQKLPDCSATFTEGDWKYTIYLGENQRTTVYMDYDQKPHKVELRIVLADGGVARADVKLQNFVYSAGEAVESAPQIDRIDLDNRPLPIKKQKTKTFGGLLSAELELSEPQEFLNALLRAKSLNVRTVHWDNRKKKNNFTSSNIPAYQIAQAVQKIDDEIAVLVSKQKSGHCKEVKGCFLTTACCTALGKGDSCWELNTLRHYRDSWLSKQDFGQEVIDLYYKKAPHILREIELQPYKVGIYISLYAFCVLPCALLIKAKLNRLAFRLYHWWYRALASRYER